MFAIIKNSRIILNMETQNESNEKLALYTIARYNSDFETDVIKGEYVSIKYAGHDIRGRHYFLATTTSGRNFTAYECELTEFAL